MICRLLLLLTSCLLALSAQADERIEICYNYGCLTRSDILYAETDLQAVAQLLAPARDAEQERELVASAIGRMYALAAQQSPVGNDRGGNYNDGTVSGRMDCIDHATSTTRFLRLFERRGWLKWHRVEEPARRTSGLFFQHFSAVLEVLPIPRQQLATLAEHLQSAMQSWCDCASDISASANWRAVQPGERYVVDSWFVDNGKAAVVLPFPYWNRGGGPRVE